MQDLYLGAFSYLFLLNFDFFVLLRGKIIKSYLYVNIGLYLSGIVCSENVIRRTDLIYAPQINNESQVYLKPETCNIQVRLSCVVHVTRFPA